MSEPLVLAIDGGNSKTDVALVRADGTLCSFVRGPLSSPHHLGLEGALYVLVRLLDQALDEAGLPRTTRPVAEIGELLLAGVDFPEEEAKLLDLVAERGWAKRTIVGNDTFALLRAGTERGWGVAVVCGAGINCLGVAPDGRHARFPALGPITGDWGGGFDVGMAALSAAARSEDGRGPLTTLEREVPAHFGLKTPLELAEAIHTKQIPMQYVTQLAPIVLAEAADDPVCAGIVDRLAAEVVALATVALRRLELTDQPAEVILGGGLLQARDRRLLAGIETGLRELAPEITVRVTASPPIVGAVLLGLDELGAGPEAQERVRRELGDAVTRLRKAKAKAAKQVNVKRERSSNG